MSSKWHFPCCLPGKCACGGFIKWSIEFNWYTVKYTDTHAQ